MSFVGVELTNPAIAINILEGQDVAKRTLLTPPALSERSDLEAIFVEGDFPAGWSSYMEIEPYTSYEAQDVLDCKGPNE